MEASLQEIETANTEGLDDEDMYNKFNEWTNITRIYMWKVISRKCNIDR